MTCYAPFGDSGGFSSGFLGRRLDRYGVVALVLDGKRFAEDTMVIALGITLRGDKVLLGFVQTGTEGAAVCATFLPDLLDGGLRLDEGLLVVLDSLSSPWSSSARARAIAGPRATRSTGGSVAAEQDEGERRTGRAMIAGTARREGLPCPLVDSHWGPEGHAIAASALADLNGRQNWLGGGARSGPSDQPVAEERLMASGSTICLGVANSLSYPQGGHLWGFINWAAGFRANGYEVVWLDLVDPSDSPDLLRQRIAGLKSRLRPFRLADSVALVTRDGRPVSPTVETNCLGPDEALAAELLFDMRYDFPQALVGRFRRSALLDTDPGILQTWMHRKVMTPARHDVYFSIGESVGRPGARFPSLGLDWIHVPFPVALEYWTEQSPAPTSGRQGPAYTTVSHWWMDEWMVEPDGTYYRNDKRSAFLPFLPLPERVPIPLELAIDLAGDVAERAMLERLGWRVREAHEVVSTPLQYREYLQGSRGEFGCAKPAYVRLRASWTSDRTPCYLASGRPVIVQDTGPSRYFAGEAGALRFSTLEEAVECLRHTEADYEAHSAAARALAEEHFDASKVAAYVLDRCLS